MHSPVVADPVLSLAAKAIAETSEEGRTDYPDLRALADAFLQRPAKWGGTVHVGIKQLRKISEKIGEFAESLGGNDLSEKLETALQDLHLSMSRFENRIDELLRILAS